MKFGFDAIRDRIDGGNIASNVWPVQLQRDLQRLGIC
jgi:hypothetical protein